MMTGVFPKMGLAALLVLGLAVPGAARAQQDEEASGIEASSPSEAEAPEDAGSEEGREGASEGAEDAPAEASKPAERSEGASAAPGASATDGASAEAAPERDAAPASAAPASAEPADAAGAPPADDAAEGAAPDDAEPTAAAAPGKTEKKRKKKDIGEDEDTATALGAASPVVASKSSKPWQIMATLGGSLGSSTFTSNQETQANMRFSFTGLYRLMPLFEGRLDALARVAFDGTLDEGFQRGLGATSPNQFFFRDVRVGLLGRGLYRSETLGLTFGANTTIDLPTSEQAQFWGRIARWNIGGNMAEMLEGVGPGNLLLVLSASFRKDIGEVNPSVSPTSASGFTQATCRSSNQTDAGNCLTDLAPLNFAFIYGGSMRYFLGSFSIGLGVTFLSNFNHDLGDSDLEGTLEAGVPASEVGRGRWVTDAPPHTLLMFTSLGATYVVNKYLNVTASLSSFQSPIRYIGDNPRGLVFPFFDSAERSFTNANLSASFMY